jgi:hypothetical protein
MEKVVAEGAKTGKEVVESHMLQEAEDKVALVENSLKTNIHKSERNLSWIHSKDSKPTN